ncbi:MAG TPA: hypothetical protein VLX68_06235 [Chitinivibrionales bacterium]|nr:hypothetical protein [Chitinivibrionales bacterium]
MRVLYRCVFFTLVISLIAGGLHCTNPENDRDRKPRLLISADTTVSVKDTIRLHVRVWADGGQAVFFKWRLDGSAVLRDTDSVCVLYFGIQDTGKHSITVTGYSDRGVSSDPVTVQVTVLLNPPTLFLLTRDTVIFANDSLAIRASASDKNGSVVRYLWSVDTTGYTLATDSATLMVGWGEQGGVHVVRAKAMDDDSILSPPESVLVTVRVTPPAIRAMPDTAVAINDTLRIMAERTDTFATIVRYVWAKNGRDFLDTTATGTFPVVFDRLSAGSRQVLVKAVDNRRLVSNVDTVRITVHLYRPLVTIIHDTAVAINDTIILHATGSDTNGRIVSYVWFRSGSAFLDTTKSGDLSLHFTRADTGLQVIKVIAVDDDTLQSAPDSVRLTIRMKLPPSVKCMKDTSVFINDTVMVHATGSESASKSPIVFYVWAKDSGPFGDTTTASSLALRFPRNSVGKHTVKVKAVDRDTLESPADSVVITVALGPPKVRVMQDTVVFINDTVFLHAAGTDTNGRVVAYAWALDGAAFSDTTVAGVLKAVWGKAGVGRHQVKVIAIDDDTLASPPDSMTVTVRLGMPVVKHKADTSVVRGDTVMATIVASDTNGTIKKYYWGTGGKEWTDSSDSPSHPITTAVHSVVTVAFGARDDDGNIATDSFRISFTAVACSISLTRPLWRDTLNLYSADLPLGKADFVFSARRKDAVPATFTYDISCGKSAAELVSRYSGNDTAVMVPAFDTGRSYFRIIAVSSHNDSAQILDSVVGVWQRQLCFIGHSIVTGMLGSPDSGGFRRMVIDTLRSLCPSKKLLRIVGPLCSHLLQPPEDDSSLAEGGRKAVDIFDSLFNHPSLNADAWVYMMGANDGYSYYGWYYTMSTIDFMHARNPKGEIYVLNNLPMPHDTTDGVYTIDSVFRQNLNTFNRMLDSVVTDRRQTWLGSQEGGVWLVDVFTPMSMLPADSVYNPVYFSDFFHPNQKGYDLMGTKITQVIRANTRIFK